MDNTDLLTTLLAVGMSIVLIFTIIALYYAVKVLRSLKSITEKADSIAGNVDSVSDFFKKTAGPVAIGKLIANLVETMRNRDEEKDK